MIAALLGIAAIVLYAWGVRSHNGRFPQRRIARWRIACYIAGTAAMTTVLLPPFDAAADASFTAHMLEHIVMLLIGPPLVLLGSPLLVLMTATPVRFARRLARSINSAPGRVLFAPVTGWIVYASVLWGVHFSPIYEIALTTPAVHVAEHALFIAAALLFWGTVVQDAYAPHPVAYPVRMFLLFFAIPQGAFLGFALGSSRTPLYPYYVHRWGSSALAVADQHQAGDLLWIAGGFLLFVAFMCTAAAWAVRERGREVAA